MSPTAVQSPLLALVPNTGRSADVIALPQRVRDLDRQRDRATEKALTPDVAADMRENVTRLLTRLAKNPGDLRGLLYDFGRHMYVAGRMDQAADDAASRAHTDKLAEAALAQVVDLVAARGEKAGA